jgi:hypothetical protein
MSFREEINASPFAINTPYKPKIMAILAGAETNCIRVILFFILLNLSWLNTFSLNINNEAVE